MSRNRRTSHRNHYNNGGFFDGIIWGILDIVGQLLNKVLGILTVIAIFFLLMGILNYKNTIQWLSSHWLIILIICVVSIVTIIGIAILFNNLKTSNKR